MVEFVPAKDRDGTAAFTAAPGGIAQFAQPNHQPIVVAHLMVFGDGPSDLMLADEAAGHHADQPAGAEPGLSTR